MNFYRHELILYPEVRFQILYQGPFISSSSSSSSSTVTTTTATSVSAADAATTANDAIIPVVDPLPL